MRSFLVLAALLAASCAISMVKANNNTLRARASFDMQCSADQLVITVIDASTSGVEGCGQRGTYVYNRAAGTWILNSPGADPNQLGFQPPPPSSSQPAGVPPGTHPGTHPGALPGTPPGSPPGTLPGAPPGSPPGTPPGPRPH